jgi:hypothetical protein
LSIEGGGKTMQDLTDALKLGAQRKELKGEDAERYINRQIRKMGWVKERD